MKKSIIVMLFLSLTSILKSQTIFEFDIVESKTDGITNKKEVYGKIMIDSNTIIMTTEYDGLIINDKISELFYKRSFNTKTEEYCYFLNENERLHIFLYENKIYSIIVSSTINHKNYITFSKKYL